MRRPLLSLGQTFFRVFFRGLRMMLWAFALVQVVSLIFTVSAPHMIDHVFQALHLPWRILDVWTQVALLLANCGLLAAEHHFGNLARTIRETEGSAEAGLMSIAQKIQDTATNAETQLRSIAASVASRCIPDFPDHIDRIATLVSEAKNKVLILADCVDYGSFRYYDAHERLLTAICRKAQEGKDVQFLVWEDPQPMSRANKYRDDTTRANDVRRFLGCITEFLSNLRQHERIFAANYSIAIQAVEKFAADPSIDWGDRKAEPLKSLDALQLKFHNECQIKKLLAANVAPKLYRKKRNSRAGEEEPPLPELFFWIVDDEVAIFILPYHGEDAIAFETRDPHLIRRLATIFQWRYFHPGSAIVR